LTKDDILAHLRGKSYNASDVIGVYPLLTNGTCRFLVYDFDNHEKGAEKKDFANKDDTWMEEVEAMRKICVLNGIDPLVERSRSGRGAHIWIFFDKPISAALVRKFGTALLDKGAEQVNLKSFKYYDRMLPAQDMLPEGGVGNLIALPLQGKALKDGNSAFIDSNWNAYPNQWEILWSKPRLSKEFIETKIREWSFSICDVENSEDGEEREKPWEKNKKFPASDIDGKMSITLSNGIYIDSTNIKAGLQNKIRRMAAISNPIYRKDLLEANKNIVISSPAISGPKVYELINLLRDKQTAGVEITIVTWEPDAYGFGDAGFWMQLHEEMRYAGFYMKTVEDTCEHFAIIDQEILWYGSMNLLAKTKIEDSMMRVQSKKIAAELMELTFGKDA